MGQALVTDGMRHGGEAPSAWIARWSHLVPDGQAVLDLACGHGRHARWFGVRGHPVVLVDRDARALASIAWPDASGARCEKIAADIESGPWPLAHRQFDGIVVTNYLWRPLFPAIIQSLKPGGVLLYETFAQGHETVGRPSRPDFLLRPGELLQVCEGLRIVAFEDGFLPADALAGARFVQRIAAVRPAQAPTAGATSPEQPLPARYSLATPG